MQQMKKHDFSFRQSNNYTGTTDTNSWTDRLNHYTGWAKKRGHRLMTIILSNLNRFEKNVFTGRFLGKFAVKWILKVPPHLAYVATPPCETLMSAKQAINNKLQGTAATYLKCGGVVNNQIKKGLLLSL